MPQTGDPEQETQAEVEEDARTSPDDRTTQREELELALMDEDASEAGEQIGQPTD
jgi:hypothetical protein